MTCCYTDEDHDHCSARRMEGLPMCQRHMLRTFRDALVAGALPPDVFRNLVQHTDHALRAGEVVQRFEAHRTMGAVRLDLERVERQRAAKMLEPVVYYVQLTGGRVKIGTTTNLPRRLVELRARGDDVLATEPGGFDVEAKRHRQFAHLRISRSEEFREDRTLTAHIRTLATEHPA